MVNYTHSIKFVLDLQTITLSRHFAFFFFHCHFTLSMQYDGLIVSVCMAVLSSLLPFG